MQSIRNIFVSALVFTALAASGTAFAAPVVRTKPVIEQQQQQANAIKAKQRAKGVDHKGHEQHHQHAH